MCDIHVIMWHGDNGYGIWVVFSHCVQECIILSDADIISFYTVCDVSKYWHFMYHLLNWYFETI